MKLPEELRDVLQSPSEGLNKAVLTDGSSICFEDIGMFGDMISFGGKEQNVAIIGPLALGAGAFASNIFVRAADVRAISFYSFKKAAKQSPPFSTN